MEPYRSDLHSPKPGLLTLFGLAGIGGGLAAVLRSPGNKR
jgi:hypothetical protein